MGRLLVFVEHKDGCLKKISRQILGYFSNTGGENDFEITAIIVGDSIEKKIINETASWGADEIILVEDKGLINYNPLILVQAITEIIRGKNPQLVLFGNTALGKDLAPRLAQVFSRQMVSDVIDINLEKEIINFIRPIYGGKAFEKIEISSNNLTFVTVRPNSLESFVNCYQTPKVHKHHTQINDNLPYLLKEVIKKAAEEKSLTEAEIIVSGGKGMQKAENFKLLEELAKVLGGAVGASRSVVDAGWMPYSVQVGQTGKTVKPKIYIACGISGAMQHLAGMSTSQVIVAINKDPDAPIFKVADYGIVGDLLQIVPLLTEELRNMYRE
ncbi:MAG: hypothetical protein JM58_18220 [Peptococcaceae bacterium BICA1-8]|nr:MAG: hypothetical protein JM58_18220 [Peptococcaceae bacterium BICA1-8]